MLLANSKAGNSSLYIILHIVIHPLSLSFFPYIIPKHYGRYYQDKGLYIPPTSYLSCHFHPVKIAKKASQAHYSFVKYSLLYSYKMQNVGLKGVLSVIFVIRYNTQEHSRHSNK